MKAFLKLTMCLMIIAPVIAQAGDGGHGSDPMKDRFIIARKRAIGILESDALSRHFTLIERTMMVAKLKTPDQTLDPSLCFERKLCWYNTDSKNHPLPPLPATLYGETIEPVLSTTPEASTAIYVDIGRAYTAMVDDGLALVMMVHDAGHSIGRSDNLEVDKIIIDYLEQLPKVRENHMPSGGAIVEGKFIRKNNSTRCPKFVEVTTFVSRDQKLEGFRLDVLGSGDVSIGSYILGSYDPDDQMSVRSGNTFAFRGQIGGDYVTSKVSFETNDLKIDFGGKKKYWGEACQYSFFEKIERN